MELHEEIRRARKDMGFTQGDLAHLARVQRRQISTLERGGNVTLSTLRKVLRFLPNLREFTFDHLRMKPEYRDLPPFDWDLFFVEMHNLQAYLEELTKAVKAWIANPVQKEGGSPEEIMRSAEQMAGQMLGVMQRKGQTASAEPGAEPDAEPDAAEQEEPEEE
jgi:transcriptional regulator with XRE-family HTH domain